ncbi:ABC transporter substrate-binding protein [Vagococcus fluvialis]|uniref:ABC transporter substrate-binding protein n=1 Tax=Vagococcus fluvialis TaxID=2738 RepID=UPI000A3421C4|nr:ABC transporter substrate-binding protein [Vagococcus fluvialis]MBO0420632.1 ABC transporter substrate-binding protein [Vagococcus fluvialis]
MKRLQVFLLGIILILGILFGVKVVLNAQTADKDTSSNNTLVIFNWGEYIDPELMKAFEKESGYHVVYSTFDSNEAMQSKIMQGGTRYDLVFPSESAVPKMLEENLLLPLDHSKIVGLENISNYLLDNKFDPGNQFTVPYFWGTFGIMVNQTNEQANQITKWSDLWKPEFENDILMVDGARESIGLALQSTNQSLNEKSPEKVSESVTYMEGLRPNVKAVLTDEIKTLMINNDAPIGIGYSGDAAFVMGENPDVKYVIPEDGSVIWTDNFAIPKTAQNFEGAYAFINFMLRPENAKQNAEYVGYATPNEKAKEMLPKELTEDQSFYPSLEMIEGMEHYEYLGKETVEMYNDLFLAWKMGL